MPIKLTLKRKLIVISLFLGVFPVIFLGVIFINTFESFSSKTISKSYKKLEEQAQNNIKSGIKADLETIQPILRRSEKMVESFAKSSVIPLLYSSRESICMHSYNEAREIVKGLIKTCNIQYKMIKNKIRLGEYTVVYILQNKGKIYLSTNRFMKWKCKNQYSNKIIELELPAFYIGPYYIEKIFSYANQFSDIVDDVQEMTGIYCSLFQVMNQQGDMLRVATNIRTDDGKRAIETYIPAILPDGSVNPVIDSILNKGSYEGIATEVTNKYISCYKAIYNDSGHLIGTFFIGIPARDSLLIETIKKSKLSNYGYAFVIDTAGQMIIHPDENMIGKNVLSHADSEIFHNILNQPAQNKEIPIHINADNTRFYACKRFKQRNWIICVTGDLTEIIEKEYHNALQLLRNEMMNLYNSAIISVKGQSFHMFRQLYYINGKGHIVVSISEGNFVLDSINCSNNDWFVHSLKLMENTFINSSVIDFLNKEIIRISSPVYLNNKLQGIVVLNVNWDMIRKIVDEHIYGKSGYTFIIDKHGIIVSHPKFKRKYNQSIYDPRFGPLGEIARQDIICGKTGHQSYYFNGKEKYVYYTPIKAMNQEFFLGVSGLVDDFMSIPNLMKTDAEIEYNSLLRIVFISLFFWIIASVTIGFFFSRSINSPLEKLVKFARNVSTGDLSNTLKSKNRDEIGFLLTTINQMVISYRKIVSEVISNSNNLKTSSINLVTTARDLSTAFKQMTEQSSNVTHTSKDMSDQISNISLKIDDMNNYISEIFKSVNTMSINTDTVASTIQQMSASMHEIGQNASKGNELTQKAVEMSYNIGDTMTLLSKAAKDIGSVVEVIKRLSYKTNLIAINASIEATTAGEAGMGFAVVSKAIQSFAEQSNEAAENIAVHITNVQKIVSQTIHEITDTSTIIREIHSSSEHIALMVKEQISVADTILSSISSVNTEAKTMKQSIDDLSNTSSTISKNTFSIAKGAAGVTENIEHLCESSLFSFERIQQVNSSAVTLDEYSGNLKQIVSSFKLNSDYQENQ
jgi:methyl-accepting chemotaxis protein